MEPLDEGLEPAEYAYAWMERRYNLRRAQVMDLIERETEPLQEFLVRVSDDEAEEPRR